MHWIISLEIIKQIEPQKQYANVCSLQIDIEGMMPLVYNPGLFTMKNKILCVESESVNLSQWQNEEIIIGLLRVSWVLRIHGVHYSLLVDIDKDLKMSDLDLWLLLFILGGKSSIIS